MKQRADMTAAAQDWLTVSARRLPVPSATQRPETMIPLNTAGVFGDVRPEIDGDRVSLPRRRFRNSLHSRQNMSADLDGNPAAPAAGKARAERVGPIVPAAGLPMNGIAASRDKPRCHHTEQRVGDPASTR